MECGFCDGLGYNEYFDEIDDLLPIKTECLNCGGSGQAHGYSEVDIIERLASLVLVNADDSLHKRLNLSPRDDFYDLVDSIIAFFSTPCKWEVDEVCVNDKSSLCADFVSNIECGKCPYFEKQFN